MKQKFLMPTGDTQEVEMPLWKTPYNHDREFESERTALFCTDESLAKQEFKEECDINVILERVMKTGELPNIVLPEHFMDLTGRTNYFDMATKIAEANETFYQLPAAKRAEFLNDPTRWADAVVLAVDAGDPKALRELGLDVPEPKPQEAAKSEITPPGATPAPGSPKEAPGAPDAAKAATGAPKD